MTREEIPTGLEEIARQKLEPALEPNRGADVIFVGMRRQVVIVSLVAMLALPSLPAWAAERRLELDAEQTEISFKLGATLHTVHGTARLGEGIVFFDPETGSASGRIAVVAASADTANQGRDKDMHSKVLESTSYPEIVFRPTRIQGDVAASGQSRIELDGTFTIHGEEHPITVDVLVMVSGERLEATVEFEVPYVAWGMKNPSKFLLKVAKQVHVRIHGVGTLTMTPS